MAESTTKPLNALEAETFTGLGDAEDEKVFLALIDAHLNKISESLAALDAQWRDQSADDADCTD